MENNLIRKVGVNLELLNLDIVFAITAVPQVVKIHMLFKKS